ncbi:MAG: cobalt-precorrin-5B (C(1))-methyltransferase CbiD [Lachnospiraceae bacterium]|nr:cobalt-precorrin-5B (C(1))-methyltransferase CbiD [Lachnospiraceae bacterium]
MRNGFTTGSCAAAASKAAAWMLLGGNRKETIEIDTPAGVKYSPVLEDITVLPKSVRCAVRKDAGDDPDITNGTLIYAEVCYAGGDTGRIVIEGGCGVGRVTRPGLDQSVGSAAINSVPRQMIEKEVREVMDFFDYHGDLYVEISVPEGEELAKKTFNPRLGIEGGISIIGTTGIVEPMSTKAILETIRVELRQRKEMGDPVAVVSPGNYGLEFMKEKYGYDLDRAVKCSNYIGDTVDMVAETGFSKLLICGHIGKLVKVAGGIMNTHSREADCRMELMAAAAAMRGADAGTIRRILSCLTTEEACGICREAGILEECLSYLMELIAFYLEKRAAGRLETGCIVYANSLGLLGETPNAGGLMEEALQGSKGENG